MNENMINDTAVQNDVELSAGEMLRNARTTGRRKREIQTVAKQLCIREEFLQALEDGDYAAIPETVYILGFARNYAMELGLDPDVVIAKIKREMGLVSETDMDADGADKGKVARAMTAAAIRNGIIGRTVRFVRRKWIWFAGGAA
ncbi:helix-turn-helix domain-containing protein, partial [bacterium]|nr:helix-turn-helix domain-containing protein [bacterium]